MIKAELFRNEAGNIYGFCIKEHSRDFICSAVSMIALNTVNSIEVMTDAHFICDHDEEGGFLKLELPDIKNGDKNHDADLLLESLALGLRSVKEVYHKDIFLKDDFYDKNES